MNLIIPLSVFVEKWFLTDSARNTKQLHSLEFSSCELFYFSLEFKLLVSGKTNYFFKANIELGNTFIKAKGLSLATWAKPVLAYNLPFSCAGKSRIGGGHLCLCSICGKSRITEVDLKGFKNFRTRNGLSLIFLCEGMRKLVPERYLMQERVRR
jgi:hypothetical protein